MTLSSERPWQQHFPKQLIEQPFGKQPLAQHLTELLQHAVTHYAKQPAFSIVLANGFSQTLNYQQIEHSANHLANFLQHTWQLQAGDVIGIQLPNSLHYPIAVLACWKIGVIISNINPLYTARELEYQLSDTQAKALIVSDLFLDTFEKVIQQQPQLAQLKLLTASLSDFFPAPIQQQLAQHLREQAKQQQRCSTPSLPFERFEAALAQGAALAPYRPQQHATAVYQYTGGTTGRSKGAIISHQNLIHLIAMMTHYLEAYKRPIDHQQCILTAIPLYHIFAFTVNFLSFMQAGGHNVLIPSPRPMHNLKPAFEQFNITWLTGVDTLYAGLLAEEWFVNHPPQLNCAIAGGTALRPSTAERWTQIVGPILEGYGMTETSCAALLHPPLDPIRRGSIGFPFQGSNIKIIDDQGQELGINQAGELCVQGPHIVTAYLNRDAESQETFIDGWLHTGDIAKIDAEGFCYILDRKKDMVLVSGFNVYPNEVEAVLMLHPHIREAAVIAVDDPQTGEAVKAFIATEQSIAPEELMAHCRHHLTAYKVPKYIEVLAELPKSTVGKILRAELRQRKQHAKSA